MSSFGLTGGIASGKSTVAGVFAELGAKIIDADKLGHEQLRPGTQTFDEIVRRFGAGILNADGEIDRHRLGDVIFADREKRAVLNSIVHPAIMARRQELTRLYHAEDPGAVVISDAALIYEAHIESWFLKMIVVWCRPEQQLERLMAKTGLSHKAAERRIHAQMNADEKRRRADYVIDTSGTLGETRHQVEALYPQLNRMAEEEAEARSQDSGVRRRRAEAQSQDQTQTTPPRETPMQDVLQLAQLNLLERIGEAMASIADPAAEVTAALDSLGLGREHLRGKRIAVAAGSRGIASLREVVRAACHWLIAQGANPFVFPAMGSHGGATDEGQRAVLGEYGVVPEFVNVEVRSSMEAVRIGETPEGFPVFMDRDAWEADGVLVINRVKPHTRFSGKVESGLLKMIAIGMGKRQGAQECHRLISRHGFERVVPSIAGAALASGKVMAGLAIVENSRHQAAAIRAAKPEAIAAVDEEMLVLAKSLLPRIPFPHLHLLIVDEIGKDVSGTGMDAKVIGRALESVPGDAPRIDLIYARDLTDETAGNGLGVGLADLIHERLYRRLDVEKMYVNARTSLNPWVVRLPMWFRSDREALDFALRACGSPAPAEQRVVSIRNTLSLDRILISEALAAEAAKLSGWRVDAEDHRLEFDDEGNLPFRH